MTTKEYLDDAIAEMMQQAPEKREPDCYLIHKLDAVVGAVTGPPLAIFKNKESLYLLFDEFQAKIHPREALTIGLWWFDDLTPEQIQHRQNCNLPAYTDYLG